MIAISGRGRFGFKAASVALVYLASIAGCTAARDAEGNESSHAAATTTNNATMPSVLHKSIRKLMSCPSNLNA